MVTGAEVRVVISSPVSRVRPNQDATAERFSAAPVASLIRTRPILIFFSNRQAWMRKREWSGVAQTDSCRSAPHKRDREGRSPLGQW